MKIYSVALSYEPEIWSSTARFEANSTDFPQPLPISGQGFTGGIMATSMQLNPTEISDLIKKRIKNFQVVAEARTEGTVVGVTDGIVRIHGLADALANEMIEFPGDTFGLALNLERD